MTEAKEGRGIRVRRSDLEGAHAPGSLSPRPELRQRTAPGAYLRRPGRIRPANIRRGLKAASPVLMIPMR